MVPPPDPGDTEDVSWALSTASAMEQRGDLFECVRWLRRAAEAASEASRSDRALALAKAAAELTQRLEESTDVGEKPTEQVDRPQARVSKPPQPPIVRPLSAPPRASQTPPPSLRAPVTPQMTPFVMKKADPTPPPPSAVAPLKSMRGTAPSTTEEWDAMPTQSLSSDDLASISRTAETPSISEEMRVARAAALGVGVHQAVRVRVWRDASGVHVAPAATLVAAPSVEAMLVGLDGTDLHAWLVGAPPRR